MRCSFICVNRSYDSGTAVLPSYAHKEFRGQQLCADNFLVHMASKRAQMIVCGQIPLPACTSRSLNNTVCIQHEDAYYCWSVSINQQANKRRTEELSQCCSYPQGVKNYCIDHCCDDVNSDTGMTSERAQMMLVDRAPCPRAQAEASSNPPCVLLLVRKHKPTTSKKHWATRVVCSNLFYFVPHLRQYLEWHTITPRLNNVRAPNYYYHLFGTTRLLKRLDGQDYIAQFYIAHDRAPDVNWEMIWY
jgi:hypothetical protein